MKVRQLGQSSSKPAALVCQHPRKEPEEETRTRLTDACGAQRVQHTSSYSSDCSTSYCWSWKKGENALDMVRGAQQYVQRAESNPASVECAEQTALIHEGSTSQLTALKGSAANIEVPDTTEHLPAGSKSWWVRVVLATDCDPSECYYLKFEYFPCGQ